MVDESNSLKTEKWQKAKALFAQLSQLTNGVKNRPVLKTQRTRQYSNGQVTSHLEPLRIQYNCDQVDRTEIETTIATIVKVLDCPSYVIEKFACQRLMLEFGVSQRKTEQIEGLRELQFGFTQ